jgi:hypothetical protein
MLLCGNLILREHSARTSRLLTLRLEVVSFEASAARTAISLAKSRCSCLVRLPFGTRGAR